MSSRNEENAVICIENEMLRYKKCVHIKGVSNHSEYIEGMIDLAARLKLINKSDAKLFRDKNLEIKRKFLKEGKKSIVTRDKYM